MLGPAIGTIRTCWSLEISGWVMSNPRRKWRCGRLWLLHFWCPLICVPFAQSTKQFCKTEKSSQSIKIRWVSWLKSFSMNFVFIIIKCFVSFAGIQGRRIYKHKGIEIWSRPISPIYQTYYSYAVAFVNRRTDGTPSDVAVTLRELGLQSPTGYRVEVN